jgi:archaellum component FlaC
MAFRRVNRQIEVFDISLMAVVTKAMGAFLVLMILLMPYYRSAPTYQKPVEDVRQELDSLRRRLAEMQQNLGRFKEDPEKLKRELAAALEQIDKLKIKIAGLERQLDQAWSQVTRLESDVARLDALRQQLEAEKVALAQEKAKAEHARDELDKRISALLPLFDAAAAKPGMMVISRLTRDVKCLKLIPENVEERARVVAYRTTEKLNTDATSEQGAILEKLSSNAAHSGFAHADGMWAKIRFPNSTLATNGFQTEESISYSTDHAFGSKQVYIVVDLPREGAACDVMTSVLLIIPDAYVQPFTLPTVQSSTTQPVKRLLAVIDTLGFPEDLIRAPTAADAALLKEKFKIDVDINRAETSAPEVEPGPHLAPGAP